MILSLHDFKQIVILTLKGTTNITFKAFAYKDINCQGYGFIQVAILTMKKMGTTKGVTFQRGGQFKVFVHDIIS